MIKKKLSLGIAVVLMLASVTVLFSAGTVEAHPPDEVSIDYDMEEEELTVDITHSVEDPQDHYIENVVVEVDGDTEIDEEYDEQPDDTSFQYIYDLAVEPGSIIEATAYCNQFGSDSDTYEVEDEIDEYELTINIDGEGTVEVDGEGWDDGDTDSFEADTDVDLEAIPDDDWEFEEWQGTEETGEYITITMDEDKDITAVFEEVEDVEDIVVEEFTVNDEEEDVEVELEEELVIYAEVTNNMDDEVEMIVSVEEDDEGIHSWEETIPEGESGTIDQVYDPHPDAWYPAEYEVILDVFDQEEESLYQQVIDVEVYDETETFELTINIEGEGNVTVEWDDHTEVVEDEHTFEIAEDTDVTLTAEADDWEFVSWNIPEDHEDQVDEEDETITFPLHTEFSTTATFEEDDDIPGFTTILLILAMVISVIVYRKNRD